MLINLDDLVQCIQVVGGRACRITEKAFLAVVFALIIVLSYFYVDNLFACADMQTQPYRFCLYLALGIVILYNIVYNYLMCTILGPGHPHQITSPLKNTINKYCRKCNSLKPTRTHHCSICNTCNLQMDHHCPWLATCIGHSNRRYFINFLSYVTLVSVQYTYMIYDLSISNDTVFYFMGSLALVVGLFTVFHWVIALMGRTTLQAIEITDGYVPKKDVALNFYIIYGTFNIFWAMAPMYRQLAYQGFQWDIQPQQPTPRFHSLLQH